MWFTGKKGDATTFDTIFMILLTFWVLFVFGFLILPSSSEKGGDGALDKVLSVDDYLVFERGQVEQGKVLDKESVENNMKVTRRKGCLLSGNYNLCKVEGSVLQGTKDFEDDE